MSASEIEKCVFYIGTPPKVYFLYDKNRQKNEPSFVRTRKIATKKNEPVTEAGRANNSSQCDTGRAKSSIIIIDCVKK